MMIKYNQTRFGGIDAPIEEQGNCFQAGVATVLQIPLEEAFDCIPYETLDAVGKSMDDAPLFVAFLQWLKQYGLSCIFIQCDVVKPMITTLKGIHMAEVKSQTLKNGESHIIVIKDGELLHDPNPNSRTSGYEYIGAYIFVPLEPHKLVRIGR